MTDYTDTYYKLTFFKFTESTGPGGSVNPAFQDPSHYGTQEDAELVAKYWMQQGFFDAVRCDAYTEGLAFSSIKSLHTGEFAIKRGQEETIWRPR